MGKINGEKRKKSCPCRKANPDDFNFVSVFAHVGSICEES